MACDDTPTKKVKTNLSKGFARVGSHIVRFDDTAVSLQGFRNRTVIIE